jgi:hypothetical protein
LGPLQYSVQVGPAQEPMAPTRRLRCRQCLLKGCERPFQPTHPQAHYCSASCQAKARQWRRHRASQRWRASEVGKARRREQSRRYRRRIPLVVVPSESVPAEPVAPSVAMEPPVATAREGQRPASSNENFPERMCDRPGCYVLFPVMHEHCCRRFCSMACRLALRRVLDREARYRERRRRGRRQRAAQRRRSPDTS